MDWCTASYEKANHPPVPALSHPQEVTVKSGGSLRLDASGSTDPDGDSLSYLWFNYPEAGSHKEGVVVSQPGNTPAAWVKFPEVKEVETAHFILRVTDKGSPRLSRYKRVVVKITPK
jgi:hypothetical protein